MVLNLWVLSLTYSSTAYVASVPALIGRFGVSRTVALLGVTLQVLGFAAGPLIFGPSSELYGRRPVYTACGLFYSAFAFGVCFAPSMAGLLVFRFLVGFFGSAQINNVPASIGDFSTPASRGPYSIVCEWPALLSPLGPQHALTPLSPSQMPSVLSEARHSVHCVLHSSKLTLATGALRACRPRPPA